jgi:hypothetical protein
VASVTAQRIAPEAYPALADALAVIYWRRQHLLRFLQAELASTPELLAGIDWTGEPKRVSVGQLVDRLIASEHRLPRITIDLMVTIAGFDDFSHLLREEDGPAKAAEARAAVTRMRRLAGRHAELIAEREAADRRAAAAADAAAAHRELAGQLRMLQQRLWTLEGVQDARRRGLQLERFLFDLFGLFDLEPRGPFVLTGEQIDGAFSFDTDDYLLEARWRRQLAAPADLAVFERKVSTKTHKTSGLFVSMHGFTTAAVDKFTGVGTCLLLAEGSDLVAVIEGRIDLGELLTRKRRHAAETGCPLLTAAQILTSSPAGYAS